MGDEGKRQCDAIVESVGAAFVGNRLLLRKLLAGALANGHVLFEDYPGLGKTLLVKAFAASIGCQSTRVQFTPDILPADIVGTKVWDHKTGEFRLSKGPVFTNVLLADEINRSPPKTQAALLEAMEERQVTIEGETLVLASPFFVLATQNPIEQEGTYPLPEAQMDRFLLRMSTGYPRDLQAETEVLRRRIAWRKDDPTRDLVPACTADEFRAMQQEVERVFIHDDLLRYIGTIVRNLRDHAKVEVGPSPRGALALLRVSRSMAYLHGRDFVTPDDVKLFVVDALAHRTILDMEQTLEGVKPEEIVTEVVAQVPVPTRFRPGETAAPASTESVAWEPDPALPGAPRAVPQAPASPPGTAVARPPSPLKPTLQRVVPPAPPPVPSEAAKKPRKGFWGR
ncbi:MAG TPA: AAA family ATPase [Candidatus Thermoplasmatota archaeon]|nr:AAA family ATPase [Candidatus Thermoplasmatota archaeon]